jgi:hypothetical protein
MPTSNGILIIFPAVGYLFKVFKFDNKMDENKRQTG